MIKSYKKASYVLIFVSLVFRLLIAGTIEFGNDDVYYWLYALQPDISHFDHPPMIGFFIQLCTFDLYFNSELWIRLAAIIPSAISMLLVYKITNLIAGSKAGFFSVCLYQLSIYGLLISGLFVLLDAPMNLFWLLAVFCFIKPLIENAETENYLRLLLGFFFAGCAIYSKYQAVYLLLGVGLYVLLYNRSWLKTSVLYLGFLLSFLFVGLIVYWNYQNDFLSFGFHSNRVSLFSLNFKSASFIREIFGQVLYNNPYVVFLIILAMRFFYRNNTFIKKKQLSFFLVFSVPLILTVLYLSLYKDTLPHWSGIAYLTLLPVAGSYLSARNIKKNHLIFGNVFFAGVILIAVGVVNLGWLLPVDQNNELTKVGKNDVTLDMFGWKETSLGLKNFLKENEKYSELPFLLHKWYPASHLHYYFIAAEGLQYVPLGKIEDTHKYYWSNPENKIVPEEALFVVDSRNYKNPKELFGKYYKEIQLLEIIPIYRSGVVVKNVFVYYLKGKKNSLENSNEFL